MAMSLVSPHFASEGSPVVLGQPVKVEFIFEYRPGEHSRLNDVVEADKVHDGLGDRNASSQ
jgi:hypothetical protein